MRKFGIEPYEIEEVPSDDPNVPNAMRITFLLRERKDENLPIGKHGVELTVSWGYELHSVCVGPRKWKRIREGDALMVTSRGWYEGKSFQCRWYFDLCAEHSLIVSYGNDGADGFVGNISSATITELAPKSQ